MVVNEDYTWDDAALGFDALGAPARLKLIRALVRRGHGGLSVGQLKQRTGLAASTLAHHLNLLVSAGLVSQEKQGRETLNRANFSQLEALAQFILDQCCAEAGDNATDPTAGDTQ